jgi:hypothetical protein
MNLFTWLKVKKRICIFILDEHSTLFYVRHILGLKK